MHRRLSAFVKGSARNHDDDSDVVGISDHDSESKASTVVRAEPLPVPSLKVKRVDYYYSRWGKTWKYRNMNSKITVEPTPTVNTGNNDPWKDYSVVIVRKLPKNPEGNQEPTFKIILKNNYIVKMCKDVIQKWPGVSWNAEPLELDPEMFLTFLPQITDYRDALQNKKETLGQEDVHVLDSVNLLLSSLSVDYRATLSTIHHLTSHSEITFDHLYAILVPRTIFVTQCAITGIPRLFELISFQWVMLGANPACQLSCESVDMVDRGTSQTIGRIQTTILLRHFKGTVNIQSLDAYPIKYHPDEKKLREILLQRGKKWVSLIGIHHRQYDGVAADHFSGMKHSVKGRIMVDRAMFRKLNPGYRSPAAVPRKLPKRNSSARRGGTPHSVYGVHIPNFGRSSSSSFIGNYANGVIVESRNDDDDDEIPDLSDEDLVLTATIVYGFSLSDKVWLEFNIDKVQDVDWNVDAFANLVLPAGRKNLLRSLVEAHHQEVGFDDFIKGKGHGLVINLFGPPGVGKTFSAEATSEHVRRPLYVLGGGELGTRASELDATLERIFDIATVWKAIVLIDEADVFLEQRSMHDLERNAMVAVFLRHVEYYRGILFLTTNRIQAFDEAFLSRIHVALHFRELTQESREQVWTAFINKLAVSKEITAQQIKDLAVRDVNGRQIKNAVRTAHSLALSRSQPIGFSHFSETLDAMEEFTKEFQGLKTVEK
ncbi:hypothetical protein BDZ94DRAFT_1227214 [Collybia nuda]|uniref:AAA+ ATPase domain-containing protein n=1 Tax=Collybia nuda TaxID=64659 RepID=A0A9P6CEC0_9AGAR|nr:hypothetical protein BDZ94DRAFT_1227214 [Collybia nuda]